MGILMPRADMLTTIKRLGLTTNLKLCLDAGDAASYTSGQSWLDRSGGGYDFFLGSDGSATATDPTFNGTAGKRSSGEYFSFDGGDWLTYDTTNETWMQNIHKDNAKATGVYWFYGSNGASPQAIYGNNNPNVGALVGSCAYVAADGGFNFLTANGTGAALTITSSIAITNAKWNMLSFSLDEAAGANGSVMGVNGTFSLANGTASSPSASSAAFTTRIGSLGNDGWPLASGSRLASFMMWEGIALTKPQLAALFMASRGKFGV